ncbi:MAG: cadherin-like beta sandwich domain-containing protein [Verrucomicrobia bacterium]|nr:cadherin-like beta sandwich domain-containing protein [Verrucomicrobiota bacterium]
MTPRSQSPSSSLPPGPPRWRRLGLGLATLLLSATAAWAQNVNVNPGAGSYATLKEAFDAINAGTHTGAVTVDIVGSTTETASAVLNASGNGAASYTSLVISPSGGAARTITGSIAGHLVDLNGADAVTIDGLNTGGNSLTISNTSTGTGSSTIRFVNDATGNTVTRCTVLGSTGSALSSGFGVIYFATGTTTGNDNNTISNCNIGPAGTNLPINGIYSFGTSAAIDNAGITISNNNIFDYFNANGITAGINVNSASSGWTISGNSLYQTATRTYLTANTHFGINVASGSGYTITNNFIGGSAASAGGTAYAMAGTIATRFSAINCSAGTTAAPHSIQGNTIANITLASSSGATTTTGVFCGINVATGSANIGTTTGNTIGSTSGVDNIRVTSTTAGALLVGIHSASAGTLSIQNNTVGALTSSGVTAAVSGSINGINISGSPVSLTVTNNTIGNTTANNLRGGTSGLTTGSSLVIGIVQNGTPPAGGTLNINSNTVRNLASFGSGTSGLVRGIQAPSVATTTAVLNVNSNTISNLTSNNTNTTLANGTSSVAGITYAGGSANSSVSDNTISNLSNTNTATSSSWVVGIGHGNSASTTIARNRIFGLANAGTATSTTAPSGVAGILVRSAATAMTIHNNMISLGNGQTTNTAMFGLFLNHASTPDPVDNVYFNTVNIEGTVAAGGQPSAALVRGDLSVTARVTAVNLRNNILTNSRTGGTGKHYAIANNLGATTSPTGWPANASNNNVLNSANPATVGFWTTDQTFSGWQIASQGDSASLTAQTIPFVNTATGDLHVNFGTTPTPIESGGAVVTGFTTDIDGQTRPGPAGSVNGAAFQPDIGADEFDGVYLDLIPPTIVYTPLPFTSTLGNRTLTATITDTTGVPTSGAGLPVLYWRINAGAYTPVTATSLGGNQFSFTFGAGAVPGDTVGYYIVAQDTATTPNVGAFPTVGASGYSANPPAAATPPTTPSSYAVTTVLSTGTYTVGAGGNYTTLTAAINDFNTRNLNGPIVFSLTDASYAEAGGMTIQKHPDVGPTNTLTIQPAAGVSASVTATAASGPVLRILNSYVTVDGSNNGTTSRDLTFTNLSTTSPNVALVGSTGTMPITNVTLKNCIFINGANSSSAVVVSDGATLGTEGYFNNITIQNNDIQRAFIGVFNIAAPIAGNGSGLTLANNLLNTSGANAIRRVGLYVQGVDGATVSGNTIGNLDAAGAENDYGIWLATNVANATVSGNTISTLGMTSGTANAPAGIRITSGLSAANLVITGNTISGLSSVGGASGVGSNGIELLFATGNVTISRNSISNIKNGATAGWGANGILLGSTLANANTVAANNLIWDVAANGFNGNSVDDNGQGIGVSAGGGYGIYYNSVNLATNQTAAAGFSTGLLIGASVTGTGAVNVRDNIFVVTTTVGTPYPVYVGSATGAAVFADINYNIYFNAINVGFLGGAQTSLTAWQTATGRDANSLFGDPLFTSATDLHLQAGTLAKNAGTPIAGISVDFDGNSRSANRPEIGADEIAPEADLSNLVLSAGTLNPFFSTGTFSYTASVGNATSSVTVTPTGIDPNQVIQVRVNGGTYTTVASGAASLPLALNVGANPIDVRATGEFGSPVVTYTVTVTRAAAPPVPAAIAIATTQGNAITFSEASVLALATDPGGNTPITLVGVGQPAGGVTTGSVTNSPGVSITFAPDAAFLGTDTFSYTIQNSLGTQASGTITVTVTEFTARAVSTSRTAGGTFSTTYAGVPNVAYRIEYTDSLTVAFQPLLDGMGQPVVILADGSGNFSFSEPSTPTKRFYRARALP